MASLQNGKLMKLQVVEMAVRHIKMFSLGKNLMKSFSFYFYTFLIYFYLLDCFSVLEDCLHVRF